MSELPGHSFGSIVGPAVENYRAHGRGARDDAAVLGPRRWKQAEQRMLILLTTSALLLATLLLLVLAASARAEERPFLWPPNNEIAETEGPWLPLDSEDAEQAAEATTTSQDEEATR